MRRIKFGPRKSVVDRENNATFQLVRNFAHQFRCGEIDLASKAGRQKGESIKRDFQMEIGNRPGYEFEVIALG